VTAEFIDTHVHFWDLKHPELRYGWLAPDAVHPILGDIDPIKSVRFDAAALWAEARFSGVVGAVHVQAAVGTPDPVVETEWLTAMAADSPLPFVIVAAQDLTAADAAEQLARHAASPLLRGIRDFGTGDFLVDSRFDAGVGLLADRGLMLDLDCAWEDMTKARDLARRHPDVPIVLEHIGYPRDTTDPAYFAGWQQGISDLATAENVSCKISGLGMNRAGWTTDGLRPWVEHCLTAFGPERCLFGTNWPVDRLWASYGDYADAFRTLISECSASEQRAMLIDNARAVYRWPDGPGA
jgi:predicted TIM-barrel fold metal-dependent hydrolase